MGVAVARDYIEIKVRESYNDKTIENIAVRSQLGCRITLISLHKTHKETGEIPG
jgi:hypothetical protein